MDQVFTKLDPQFMLILFLPALIFESAFSCDYYTFRMQLRMQLGKILILAFPMLLAATFLTATVMYYVLNYGPNQEKYLFYNQRDRYKVGPQLLNCYDFY